MAQGQFVANSVTVVFDEISVSEVPELVHSSRIQNVPGISGGLHINLGKSPRQFDMSVTCIGPWAVASATKDYNSLVSQEGYSGTLTIHDRPMTAVLANVTPPVSHKGSNSTTISHQAMTLTFVRLS